ncbi:hypothetical protein M5689_007237 [Euphorbia peplus]|nr:hypothetical protein M5689_007237 [Euphorbia peplus]
MYLCNGFRLKSNSDLPRGGRVLHRISFKRATAISMISQILSNVFHDGIVYVWPYKLCRFELISKRITNVWDISSFGMVACSGHTHGGRQRKIMVILKIWGIWEEKELLCW